MPVKASLTIIAVCVAVIVVTLHNLPERRFVREFPRCPLVSETVTDKIGYCTKIPVKMTERVYQCGNEKHTFTTCF